MDTSIALNLIDKYYSEYPLLRSILLTHSQQVCSMALQVVDAHPEWARDKLIDRNFIVQASLLHDIGILFCDASTIHCIGHHPYIEHGFLGAQLLRQEGLERHALVAERHTGSGLTKEDIVMQQINIPIQDYLPISLEEKVICFADKFFSKSKPTQQLTLEQIHRNMSRFGDASFNRWLALEKLCIDNKM